MKNPKVSVVLPCYNAEKYIGSCIEMLKSQSYDNLEIIVIIDGKTDNSEQIARSYNGIKLIVFEKNRGLSAGRNAGIDAATGKYIHFMDVDDKVNMDFYSNSVKVAEETGADITCTGLFNERWKEQSCIFKNIKVKTKIKDKLRLTWAAKWGYSVRYLFNLNFLRSTGIRFEEGRFIEDMPVTLQLIYYSNKMVTAPGTLYYYNYVPESITNTQNSEITKKREVDRHHSKEMIKRFAKEKGIHLPGQSYDFEKIFYLTRKYFLRYFRKKNIMRHVKQLMDAQSEYTD